MIPPPSPDAALRSGEVEVLVVGAGPAGVSAGLWARSLGVEVEMVESTAQAGGQLHQIHFEPPNYPGEEGLDGPALGARLGRQLERAGVPLRHGAPALALDLRGPRPAVSLEGGERVAAAALLIATGVRRRPLDVPGEAEFEGHGVSYSATQDRARFAGEDVVVVGGGDAAFENALLLAEVGCRVTLALREAPRARAEFRDRVAREPGIEVLEGVQVAAILGASRVEAVAIEDGRGRFELPAAGVVIKVGVMPNTEWCRGAVELDPDGYVLADEHLGTSHPRVWAAGDVVRPPLFGLAVAIGQGALAVAAIRMVLRDQ